MKSVRLKFVARFAYGDSLSSDHRTDGDVPVYGSNGIVGTHCRANTLAPAIVVGRKGSFGKLAYSSRAAFCIDTTFFIDRRFSRTDLRWLYYALQTAGLDELSQDTGVPGLSRETAYEKALPVPAEAMQREIATFLDRKTAAIDALIAKKERLIELLQEKRQALITQAVTKGLDPNVPMKESGVPSLGRCPAHWQLKRLMHLTPSRRQIMYGIVLPGPNVAEGIPIVKSGDCVAEKLRLDRLHRTTPEIEAPFARARLEPGDIVYAIRGSIGMAAMVPPELRGANLTQDAARIAPRFGIGGRWLLYVVQSTGVWSQLQAGVVGATVKGINIRDLKRPMVPVPPQVEQNQIFRFLDGAIGGMDKARASTERSVELLREYRQALITAAVTGKIDVTKEAA